MSLAFRSIFTIKNPTSPRIPFSPTLLPKPANSLFLPPNSRPHCRNHLFLAPKSQLSPSASIDDLYSQIDSSASSSSSSTSLNVFNFDGFLSIFEFLSLASSAAISLYAAAISCGVKKRAVFGWVGSKVFVWQCVVLVASVVVGALIRRRQWRRLCGAGFSKGSASYGNTLLRRVEKLEEDLRSSATIIRVLSRQLDKLSNRVRTTRKAQKEPISETAALAQKNSEATRALAAQDEILEKELGEIQKVLLAMQEQQQKQLDLILAVGKAKNLFSTQPVRTKGQNMPEASNSSEDVQRKQIKTLDVAKQANHD